MATMRIGPDRLESVLQRDLAPVWLVSGEEPLLAGEAADAIRAAARGRGHAEREVHFVERGVSWPDIAASTQALSLFATRRIVEIRMPGGKPGHGAATLAQIAQTAGDDLLLLVIVEKLDRDAKASAWVQAIESRGVHVAVSPPDAAQFPAWLARRAKSLGLAMDGEAVAALASFTEGNLLAADQEIRKLLLAGHATVDAAMVVDAVTSSSRFDVSRLTEVALAGDAREALRVLASLRAEGTESVLVLWAILREMRNLWMQLLPGARLPAVWSTSPAAAARAAQRIRPQGRGAFTRLAERASRVDRMIKGRLAGDAWDEMALLVTELAGVRALPLPRIRP